MDETKLFAVVGNPVLHSKSPSMFNPVFRHRSRNDIYTKIAAPTAQEAIFLFKELQFSGVNVTAPFKQDIIPYLDELSSAASEIGSVNTIVSESGKLIGYNTDYIGVSESLRKMNIPLPGKRIVVLGAGGAARAAVYALTREKYDSPNTPFPHPASQVTVVNRTYKTAQEIALQFGCRADKIENLQSLLKETDILISTISPDLDLINREWLRKDMIIFDANYKKSILSEKANEIQCTVIKGEAWLLNQAGPALQYFTQTGPTAKELEIMQDALVNSMGDFSFKSMPAFVSLVGFMGSGKSTLGKILAQRLGCHFKDTDQMIEEKEGRTIPEIFHTHGEPYFRKLEKEAILEVERFKNNSGDRTRIVISYGGGAVLDDQNKAYIKNKALAIWLYASIPTTLDRIQPGTRPLLHQNSSPENGAHEAARLLSQRRPHYARASHVIVGSERKPEEIAEKIYAELCKTFRD